MTPQANEDALEFLLSPRSLGFNGKLAYAHDGVVEMLSWEQILLREMLKLKKRVDHLEEKPGGGPSQNSGAGQSFTPGEGNV